MVEEVGQVGMGGELDVGRQFVAVNSEVGAGHEPEVVRQARVVVGWIVILRRVGAGLEKSSIDVGSRGVPDNCAPVVILEDDEEDGFQGVVGGSSGTGSGVWWWSRGVGATTGEADGEED